jgi:hypothetical protein
MVGGSMNEKIYFVYKQKCNGVVFYVGITANKLNRPFYFGAHNDKYEGFLAQNLTSNFSVEISESMYEDEAREYERLTIQLLESQGVWLANEAWTKQTKKPMPRRPSVVKYKPKNRRAY